MPVTSIRPVLPVTWTVPPLMADVSAVMTPVADAIVGVAEGGGAVDGLDGESASLCCFRCRRRCSPQRCLNLVDGNAALFRRLNGTAGIVDRRGR